MKKSVLFVGKKNNIYCERAVELVSTVFSDCQILLGGRGEGMPDDVGWWKGDYILSYLSPWILPESLLCRAEKAAINFHPGPPEYPGIGCTNFAVYNGESRFGITCHHMLPKVDTGRIISVRRFPIYDRDSIWTLTQRCYTSIEATFQEIVAIIAEGSSLPTSSEEWTRRPYKRKELDELCRITSNMPVEEVRRRIRAVSYPNAPGAFTEVGGYRFVIPSDTIQPEQYAR